MQDAKGMLKSPKELKSYKLSGTLVDEEQQTPLEFASIGIYQANTDRLIMSSVTDFDGNFSIKLIEGVYDVKFDFISYEEINAGASKEAEWSYETGVCHIHVYVHITYNNV